MAGEFKGYGVRKGQKEGGIHAPDPDGGIYKTDTNTFLIKRDGENPQNDIAEYLASSIFAKTAPGHGAEIELVKNTSKDPDPKNKNNQNAFLASRYFKDYKDFFNEAGYKNRPEKLEAIQGLLPGRGYVSKELTKKSKDGAYKYDGYEKSLVTSLLLGDFSVHSGNMGVIGKENDQQKKLVRIDFGAAFRDMQPDINPYKSVKNRIGLEKNYFLRDHPTERIESKEFAAELRRVAASDLTDVINDKWNNIVANFDERAIKDFGKGLGIEENKLNPENIKAHFFKTLQERQQSLRDIATEIDLNIAIKTKDQEKIVQAVVEAVKENPDHCKQIVENPKETQLQTKYSKQVLKLIENELSAEKEKIITVPPVSNKPEQQSLDNTLFSKVESVVPEKSNLKKGGTTIISYVREQIVEKQTEIIKKAIGENNPAVAKLNKEEFNNYLKNPNNKSEINNALENPPIKKVFEREMHQASVASYKDFHEKFKDELKPVKWEETATTFEKSQVVKNPKGEEVCTLTEKTIERSEKFILADGTEKNVSSYRSIDFPASVKEGTGPVHFSMALKDSEGKNMKVSDAVYFTAHYDETGKLNELTCPKPIKFKGNDPNSPGYIEHNGEIFTLPVTQSKYQEMMKEVAKNQGIAVDISQKIETKQPENKDLQKDKVSVIEKFPPDDKKQLEQIKEKMRSSSSRLPVSTDQSSPVIKQNKVEDRGR